MLFWDYGNLKVVCMREETKERTSSHVCYCSSIEWKQSLHSLLKETQSRASRRKYSTVKSHCESTSQCQPATKSLITGGLVQIWILNLCFLKWLSAHFLCGICTMRCYWHDTAWHTFHKNCCIMKDKIRARSVSNLLCYQDKGSYLQFGCTSFSMQWDLMVEVEVITPETSHEEQVETPYDLDLVRRKDFGYLCDLTV